jgi:hypothetical protein
MYAFLSSISLSRSLFTLLFFLSLARVR